MYVWIDMYVRLPLCRLRERKAESPGHSKEREKHQEKKRSGQETESGAEKAVGKEEKKRP